MYVEVIEWVSHGGLPITTVDFQPNGKRIATGGNDRTIRIWNTALFGPDAPPPPPPPSPSPSPSLAPPSGQAPPDSYGLLAVLTNHTAPVNIGTYQREKERELERVGEKEKKKERGFVGNVKDIIFIVRWSPNGYYLASGSDDMSVLIFCHTNAPSASFGKSVFNLFLFSSLIHLFVIRQYAESWSLVSKFIGHQSNVTGLSWRFRLSSFSYLLFVFSLFAVPRAAIL
jgi:WD40 repeat protein